MWHTQDHDHRSHKDTFLQKMSGTAKNQLSNQT
jgi:hypothetical protein